VLLILTKVNVTTGFQWRFAPGSSGNLGGRPRDEARVAELVYLMRHGKD